MARLRGRILVLSLIALLFLVLAAQAEPSRVVPAEEILKKIELGQAVEYDNVIIVGDMDVSTLNLTKVPVQRTDYETLYPDWLFDYPDRLDYEMIVASPIRITNSRIKGSVNLNGATMQNVTCFKNTTFDRPIFMLSSSFKQDADFSKVKFNNNADFSNAQFNQYAYFIGAKFIKDADFSWVKFNQSAAFNGAEFKKNADFEMAEFKQDADFSRVKFNKDAHFSNVKFNQDARFGGRSYIHGKEKPYLRLEGVEFKQDADFIGAEFNRYAIFSESKFNKDADFGVAEFKQDVSFSNAQFKKNASFTWSKFNQTADFRNVQFNQTNFGNVQFNQTADFQDAQFNWKANFWEALFNQDADFNGTQFNQANFGNTQFSQEAYFQDANFRDLSFNYCLFSKDVFFDNAQINGTLSLYRTKYDRLNIRWSSIHDLAYDDTAYYLLIENFKKQGFTDDASECYYSYRCKHREELFRQGKVDNWFFDLLAWATYGYGLRPVRPLGWSVLFILLGGAFFFLTKSISRSKGPEVSGNRLRAIRCKDSPQRASEVSIWEALLLSATYFTSGASAIISSVPQEFSPLGRSRYVVVILRLLGWVFFVLFLTSLGKIA